MKASPEPKDPGSQTLSRGLRALHIIGDSETPLSVLELSKLLNIHRSMTYRLVGTLASFGFVQRNPAGKLELGISLTILAKGVSKSLQHAAAPELRFVADTLGMTAFLVVYDGEAAVTISNTEPRNATSTVAKKPGSRHPIDRGAPGKVIRSQVFPDKFPPRKYEYSQNEVLPGLAAIAVPLRVDGMEPAALAVLFLPQAIDEERIYSVLTVAAKRIVASVGQTFSE